MPKICEYRRKIEAGELDPQFNRLYPRGIEEQKKRYLDVLASYGRRFGEEDDVFLFSSPGRTELGGNHTDHNCGKVLAGSVDLDVVAVASATSDPTVEIHSDAFPTDRVDLGDLSVREEEKGKSAALIRGVAKGFLQKGLKIGGFRAVTHSNVPKGSGVSSSAAYEVLLGTVQNHFYNHGEISPMEIAKISQFAEREYFGKPCGLMDQAACALGGVSMIDFADSQNPKVTAVPFDFAQCGWRLCLVAVGGDHANLTHLYAAIPQRMASVSTFFGKNVLNEVSLEEFLANLPKIREQCGDLAVLASLHFLQENKRVEEEAATLLAGDFPRFLSLVNQSGHSSFEALQNVLLPGEQANQGAALSLSLSPLLLEDCGAWRIHGGGFGGTTLHFVPEDRVEKFKALTESVFGANACHVLSIRPVGPVCLF